ncbi:hypothetical protein ES703_122072 [subsurface metagenome]
MYSAKRLSPERIVSRVFPLHTLLSRKYWFDEVYENIIVGRVLNGGLFAGLQLFDSRGVDGAVNGVADGAVATGRAIRRAQTGQLQLYGIAIGVGILVISICLYIWG